MKRVKRYDTFIEDIAAEKTGATQYTYIKTWKTQPIHNYIYTVSQKKHPRRF